MFSIQEASQEMSDQMFYLINDSYQKGFSGVTSDGRYVRYQDKKDLLSDLDHYKAKVLVYKNGNQEEVIGTIFYSNHYRGDQSYFGTLCIKKSPEFKGQKLGKRMIEQAEGDAIKDNHRYLYILVLATQENLLGFYKKNGFVETGNQENVSEEVKNRLKPEFQDKGFFLELRKDLVN